MRQSLSPLSLLTSCCLSALALVTPLSLTAAYAQPQPGSYAGQTQTAPPLENIVIIGNQRIEEATIRSYTDIRQGDAMTRTALNSVLKRLFATGLFADVVLRQKDTTLEIEVQENPLINQVAFEGNQRIEDEELQSEVQLRSRQVLTRTKVQSDVARLYQVYRRNGRFSVKIEPKIIELDQNRVNVVFEIDEGDITTVRTIRFVGNERYSDRALREVISTQESVWYNFLSNSDRYDPDRVSFDQELLRRFYLSEGYVDFRLVSATAELSPDQDDFFVTFTIEEGERYKIGDIQFDSRIPDFDTALLEAEVTFDKGDWYNAEEVQATVEALSDTLGDAQYAFVAVRPDIQRNRDNNTVDVIFKINETPPVFIEEINISGNVRTLDEVIRREIEVAEGDPFNRTKVARSEQRVRDLGYFESVGVETSPGSAPDKSVIDINVEEQSTGELSVGAGFSTIDGPLADFRIRERNFLGRGQDVLAATTIAGERTEFNLSLTEPYFLDRDFSATTSLFHQTRDFQDQSSFNQRRTGGGLTFGYPLSQKWRQSLGYRLELNDVNDVQDTASLFIREQAGERITSSITMRTTYDDRDSRLFPTEGLFSWLDTEVAGLGGDAQFVSGRLGSNYYIPVTDSIIFSILGEVGGITAYGDQTVRINERFYLGGNNFRGFDLAGLGPRDANTDDALGGNFFYRGTAEFSFPVGFSEDLGVMGHAFTDVGTLFDVDETTTSSLEIRDEASLRASAGLGISWRSPFGPIRVDFAVPYLSEEFDEERAFLFDFGTRF